MPSLLRLDPAPKFDLSPNLYMQFMEPLGTTDSSVEAAWDFIHDSWRPEFIEAGRRLAPGCIRWGGILTSFWKWREGVGPRDQRTPMHNYLWGGLESNQIGVHEIIALCRLLDAEPLMAVNFAADGRPAYIQTAAGEQRAGTAEEAADLVSYCNDPQHAERRRNGAAEPFQVRLWQIGNETSYPEPGQRFSSQQNAEHYLRFAQSMRERDPQIQLIGWGDEERHGEGWFARDLLAQAGEYVDYVAAHMMNQHPPRKDTVLTSRDYEADRDRAWAELGEIYQLVADKLDALRQVVRGAGSKANLALTEGHLSLKPHNINPLLTEWLAGLYNARIMSLYERHGDFVKIATQADFFGNRWTVNALMVGGAFQKPYLLPAGVIMSFFRRCSGPQGLAVPPTYGALELSASRRDNTLYVHVVNTALHESEPMALEVAGMRIKQAYVEEIAPGDLSAYVDHERRDTFTPERREVPVRENRIDWTFPSASVSALVIEVEPEGAAQP
jgi:alpha-L-arabinofuranosidase